MYTYPLPAHAMTRSQRRKRNHSEAVQGSFCASEARAKRDSHAVALARALQTPLTQVSQSEDFLMLVMDFLLPREVARLMRSSKGLLSLVLRMYMPADAKRALLAPNLFVVPRASLPFGTHSMRRGRIFLGSYLRLVATQFSVSLRAAVGGLAQYHANSHPRRFSLECVFGKFCTENMTVCRCVAPPHIINAQRLLWRSADRKELVRCALCAVARERVRYVWRLGEDGLIAAASWEDIKTFRCRWACATASCSATTRSAGCSSTTCAAWCACLPRPGSTTRRASRAIRSSTARSAACPASTVCRSSRPCGDHGKLVKPIWSSAPAP